MRVQAIFGAVLLAAVSVKALPTDPYSQQDGNDYDDDDGNDDGDDGDDGYGYKPSPAPGAPAPTIAPSPPAPSAPAPPAPPAYSPPPAPAPSSPPAYSPPPAGQMPPPPPAGQPPSPPPAGQPIPPSPPAPGAPAPPAAPPANSGSNNCGDAQHFCCSGNNFISLSCFASIFGAPCGQSICCTNVGSGSQTCSNQDGLFLNIPISFNF